MEKEKKYTSLDTTKFMIKTLWARGKSLIIVNLLIVFITVILNLTQLFMAPTILNLLEINSSGSKVLIAVLLFTLSLMICNGLNVYFERFNAAGKLDTRLYICELINKKKAMMSYPFLDDDKINKKIDKAMATVWGNFSSTEAIWQTLIDLLVAFSLFIIYIILLTNVNIILIIVSSVISVLSYFVIKKINEWGYRNKKEKEEYISRISYAQKRSEDVSFAKDIRIFGMREWVDDMYYASVSLLQNFITRGEKQYIKADFIDLLLTFSRNGITYYYLINLILANEITTAEFLLYLSTVTAFTSMLKQFLEKMNEINKHSIEISSVLEFLNLKEIFKFEDGEKLEIKENEKYEIELKNVSFKYESDDKYTIKNFNLTLKQGEKLAIVGLNGAGKTTLVKLICGFYNPSEGEVLLNGKDIKKYNRRDYYKFFTAVFQDFSILEITVLENITQSVDNANLEKVKDCIEKAGLTDKINSLEKGINTYVGRTVYDDGVELSGGENQRLMLARALYRNSPFIILDEPTAALDPIAESDIYNKYNDMTKDKTSIFISHRLASTRFCDRIIMLQDGNILEMGTHAELLNLNGEYAKLYDVQSKYYKEGVDF